MQYQDSDIGRRIVRAKLGIVFHTVYSGKTMDNMTAGFGSIRKAQVLLLYS